MRKAQKKQLLEILKTLYEAHEAIRKYLKKGEPEVVLTLLGDCQQSAIRLGTIIEESEGEDCPSVAKIENYCEELYQTSLGILDRNTVQKVYKRLNKALHQVESSAIQDIHTRLEVVFLPYKSSMFDSLESIWRAADADPDCDAYVIPIPYYDKNLDGSFREMHYEGGQYPEDVPVVHYESYDFEKRQPDVIFIHNSYDNNNRVTSIHPDFYAARLRDYTACLAYVPYFLLPSIFQEHFAATSGVVMAHKVFVQNEKIRQGYIQTLMKLGCGFQESEIEKRIVAIGSPKTDKIIQCHQTGLPVPPGWQPIVEGKKVLFFNTNVSMILHNSDHFLEHLRDVFEVFRSHSEFAVIWREHPLTVETLRSMRPQMMEDYLAERERFIAEGLGILDTSPTPYPAMTLSDCYFGAGGSLSAIYPMTGKPIMLADYLYPARISPKPITLDEMIASATGRMFYLERNINSLDLFLSHISVFEAQKALRIKRQSHISDHLDGTVGQRIYDHVKSYLDERWNGEDRR